MRWSFTHRNKLFFSIYKKKNPKKKIRKLLDEGMPALNLEFESGAMYLNTCFDDNYDSDDETTE